VTYYAPGTQEKDPAKVIMSLQQAHEKTATNTTDIATNAADIAALQTAGATYVVGPASATANGFAVYNGTTGKLIKDHAATIALGSEVSGTLPVANGGTNYTGGAFSTFTPTPTAETGSFTTVSASGSYLNIGKLVMFCLTITITNAGTATGYISVALPTGSPARGAMVAVGETNNTGLAGIGRISTGNGNMLITKYDAGTLIATNNILFMSGLYEIS
jgi:hypothetical protein